VHLQCNKNHFTNLRLQEEGSVEAARKRKRVDNPGSSRAKEGQVDPAHLPVDKTSPIGSDKQVEASVVEGTADGSSVVPTVEESALPVAPCAEDAPTHNQAEATSADVAMIASDHQRVRLAH
jgi:hypothetical protein